MMDPSEYEEVVEECHQLLTEAGVEDCPPGTECNDPRCQSKLYHRIHTLIEERDALKEIVENPTSEN